MRTWALLLLAAGMALPLLAADPVTVRGLETALAKANRKPDARVAKQLSQLELTERLSTVRCAQLQAEMPGELARQALIALADESAFLDLPASEIPAGAPLDRAAQNALMAKTTKYARETLSRLPDFFAKQQTLKFSDEPPKPSQLPDHRLHLVAASSATVRFLGGREEIDLGPAETRHALPMGKGLAVQGVFGPVLRVVLKDALLSHPAWSHWEPGPNGPIAVFAVDVPEGKSHFAVATSATSGILQPFTAYRGEIGIDPASGAIIRLMLEAVPRPDSTVARAAILVEYGPVEIAGRSYICPLKSVAVSLARGMDLLHDLYKFPGASQSPFKLELNDVSYTDYHLFATEMQLLPADGASGEVNPPDGEPKSTPQTPPQR